MAGRRHQLQGYRYNYCPDQVFVAEKADLEDGLVFRPAVEGIEDLEHGQGGEAQGLSAVYISTVKLPGKHQEGARSHKGGNEEHILYYIHVDYILLGVSGRLVHHILFFRLHGQIHH